MKTKKKNKIEPKKSEKNGLLPIFFYFLISFLLLLAVSAFIYYQYHTQIGMIKQVRQEAAPAAVIFSFTDFVFKTRTFAFVGEALVVFFLFFLGLSFLAFYKYFLEPLSRLRKNIDKMLGSNFDYKITANYKNSFTYLDDFLNTVSARFREAKTAVEQSAAQRGKELDRVVGKLWKENIELENKELELAKLLKESQLLDEQLKQEKDFVDAIVSCIDEGLFATDISGKITFFNQGAARMLEVSKEDALGKNFEEILVLYEGLECENKVSITDRPLIKAIRTGQTVVTSLSDNYCFLTKGGKKIAVILASSPLLNEDKVVGAVATFRNVNTEKLLDEAKNSFISIASHQMRTPLTSMRWFSEMLISKDAGALNKEQRQYINQVYQGIERMTNLLDLLLQISRIEAGRVKVDPTPINFKEEISEVIAALKPLLNKKSQKVITVFEPDDFPVIAMDKEMIWEVFINFPTPAVMRQRRARLMWRLS